MTVDSLLLNLIVMTVDSLLLNLIVIFVMVVFRCSLLRSFVPYFHTYKYSQRVCH